MKYYPTFQGEFEGVTMVEALRVDECMDMLGQTDAGLEYALSWDL